MSVSLLLQDKNVLWDIYVNTLSCKEVADTGAFHRQVIPDFEVGGSIFNAPVPVRVVFTKSGRLVSMYIEGHTAVALGANFRDIGLLTPIPEEFRPQEEFYSTALMVNNSLPITAYLHYSPGNFFDITTLGNPSMTGVVGFVSQTFFWVV
jgi:hypothetical protein